MKKTVSLLLALSLVATALTACGSTPAASAPAAAASSAVQSVPAAESTPDADLEAALSDGVYTAEFNTDSGMFSVNEACDGKGTLTVQNGEMTIHVSLLSQKILNLYAGLAEDAQKEGAVLLQPTVDTVTYSDGVSEEVYGFDIPVPAIGEEFDVALVGAKGTWYDHKVSVQNPVPQAKCAVGNWESGSYTCAVTLDGGSGRATVESPAVLTIKDGVMTATIVWSSANYDYMKIGDTQYLPTNTEGNSTFEIPVEALDTALSVIGDTVAMSTPHEVEYTLTFDSASIQPAA